VDEAYFDATGDASTAVQDCEEGTSQKKDRCVGRLIRFIGAPMADTSVEDIAQDITRTACVDK
jgi:hypothetical protein